jgi:hypothetical protein
MESGRARALLLLALACCGALVIGAIWTLRVDDSWPSERELRSLAPHPTTKEATPDPAAASPSRAPEKERSDHAADDGAAADGDPDTPFRGTGTVTLTVVDAATGAPIADLPFLCWSERPTTHVYARSVTDAKGQAELANLPEDVVIFETARRPPNANTIFATWLPKGGHREVTMRVGHGGKVVGRVVDDLGKPLSGVEIRFDSRPAQEQLAGVRSLVEESPVLAERFRRSTDLVAKSGADGRFEADALLSRFGAIWITHGAPDPRNESPIRIELKWRQWKPTVDAKVHEGATSDLGDVKIPRSAIFAGRVVEKDGTPVAGALVSARATRGFALWQRPFDSIDEKRRSDLRRNLQEEEADMTSWPGERDFKLADEETFTANDGGFELDVSTRSSPTVVTRDGRLQYFSWPESAAGTRTDGIEFRLKSQTIVLLSITQSGGRPIETSRPNDWYFARVIAVADDGGEAGAMTQDGGAGHFQARFDDLPKERIVALVVETRGYARWRAPWKPPQNGRDSLAVDLVPLARRPLKLRLKLHDPSEAAALRGRSIQVLACLLGPERVLGSKASARCGLDVDLNPTLRATTDVDLQVANDRTWNVYVQGPFVADSLQYEWIHAGAFTPGDGRHEFELPPVSANWVAEQARLELEAQKHQEHRLAARRDGNSGSFAKARVTAVDAQSGAAIARPRVSVRSSDEPNSWSGFGSCGSGETLMLYVPSGRHAARVGAAGYRDAAEIEYTAEPGGSVDLGQVALESMPRYALELVDRSGAPAAGRYSVSAYFPDSRNRRFGGSDVNGVALAGARFELRAELPDSFVLAVAREADESGTPIRGSWGQRFQVDRWSPGETHKIELGRWHATTITIDLSSIAADLRGAGFRFEIARQTELIDLPHGSVEESHDSDADQHLYRVVLPSGRYVLRGGNSLFAIPDTPLELTDEQDDVTLKLAAR